ncbi:MAG: hypothetical protein RSB99_03715 [Bacilli bacterium]
MLDFILKYWIQILFGSLISLAGVIFKQLNNYRLKVNEMQNGIRVILKLKISEYYEKVSNKKCITMYEKELITEAYDNYHNLGGNGFIEELMENINLIPVKNDCSDK